MVVLFSDLLFQTRQWLRTGELPGKFENPVQVIPTKQKLPTYPGFEKKRKRESFSEWWSSFKDQLRVFLQASSFLYTPDPKVRKLWQSVQSYGSKAAEEVSTRAPPILASHPYSVAPWSGEKGGVGEGGSREQWGKGEQEGRGESSRVDEQAAAAGEEGGRAFWPFIGRSTAAKLVQQQRSRSHPLPDCGSRLVPPLLQLPPSNHLSQLPSHLGLKLPPHHWAASTLLPIVACKSSVDSQPGGLRLLPAGRSRVCQWELASSSISTIFWLPGILWQVSILFQKSSVRNYYFS